MTIEYKLHNATVTIDGNDFSLVGTVVDDVEPPIEPPEPEPSAKRWNPGHYLKTQGNHAKSNQGGYWSDVNDSINTRVEDIPEILGAYVTIAWGVFNPVGSTYSWSEIDEVLASLTDKGKRLILELSYKSFTSGGAGLEAPSDLSGEIERTNSGWFAGVHRANVMDRYISAVEAIADRYDSHDNFEIMTNAETAPSFGSNEPGDYSKGSFAVQLRRLYSAAAQVFVKSNYCPLVNHLGKEVPDLVEEIYQLRIGLGGPDARQDMGWDVFKGGAGAVRDYRQTIPRYLTASMSSLNKTSPEIIINESQENSVTHLSWISSHRDHTWTNIKLAIQANPDLYTDCPTQYENCS